MFAYAIPASGITPVGVFICPDHVGAFNEILKALVVLELDAAASDNVATPDVFTETVAITSELP
jgi:hypothetical protein